MNQCYSSLMREVVLLAERAGDAIMPFYQSPDLQNIEQKADSSPVTAADLAAHKVLVEGLPAILNVPVLSEESAPTDFEERSAWHCYWLVDPLDGTKEFISGNGEFTVNVALIEGGDPVMGVVHTPVQQLSYCGARGVGAYKNGEPIAVRQWSQADSLVVVSSRRHGSEAAAEVLQSLQATFDEVVTRQVGSSLKFCLLAEGVADCYPRLAPTCEWDTAAAQAVLEAAGGRVVDWQGEPLRYNQKRALLNPFFVAVGAEPSGQQLLKTIGVAR